MTNRNLSRSQRDGTLKQVERLAWLLDNSIRIPLINYRIGLDALIGLIPGFGDVAGMILSSFIVLQAIRLGATRTLLVQMLFNIGIEALIGLVPGIGDLFDAAFKANIRNVRLLRTMMSDLPAGRTMPPLVSRWVIVAIVVFLLGAILLVGWLSVLLIAWLYSLIIN